MALSTLGVEFGDPIVIHSASHHMHELGTSQTSTMRHADGTESCLLDIPDWDFNWQGAYKLVEPVVLVMAKDQAAEQVKVLVRSEGIQNRHRR